MQDVARLHAALDAEATRRAEDAAGLRAELRASLGRERTEREARGSELRSGALPPTPQYALDPFFIRLGGKIAKNTMKKYGF